MASQLDTIKLFSYNSMRASFFSAQQIIDSTDTFTHRINSTEPFLCSTVRGWASVE